MFEGGLGFLVWVGEAAFFGEGHEFLLDGGEFLFGAFHLGGEEREEFFGFLGLEFAGESDDIFCVFIEALSCEGRGEVSGPCDGDEVGIFFGADDDFLLEGCGGDFWGEGGGGFFHERAAVHHGGDGGGVELARAEGFAELGGLEGGGHLAADELDLGGEFGGEAPFTQGEGSGGAEEGGEDDP